MRSPEVIVFTAVDADAGRRLDQVVAERLPQISRARAQALLRGGAILVDDQPQRPAHRVRAGQLVRVVIPPPEPALPQPETLPLRILHEDDALVVIDKAPGMVVHPAPGNLRGTLVNALLGRYGGGFEVGGQERPGIVHRLDKGTSGVMLVARTDAALAALQAQFQRRTIRKQYLAVVCGQPPDRGDLDTPYGRHPTDRTRYTTRPRGRARRAALRFRTTRRGPKAALLEVELLTGRTHQIRVQLAEAGHPLVGDDLYGRRRIPFHRPALHAWRLAVDHPTSGERLTFEAPVPQDLLELMAALLDEASA